jgi:hypothetical protein
MKALAALLNEILGLFVDDQNLAAGILAVVAVCCVLTFGLHVAPALVGDLIVVGCLTALAVSTLMTARRPH